MRALGVVAALLASTVAVAPAAEAQQAQALADKPCMGWSSWSLQATNHPGVNPDGPASWLNQKNVLRQADVLAAKFKKHGYDHVNVDAGWSSTYDEYARPIVDAKKVPDGMKYVADYVHRKGLKLGSYLAVGLDIRAYNNGNSPIHGTTNCHTRDIVYPDLRKTNGLDPSYKINFDNQCSQAYTDSLAKLLASWDVGFLKLDGGRPTRTAGASTRTSSATAPLSSPGTTR